MVRRKEIWDDGDSTKTVISAPTQSETTPPSSEVATSSYRAVKFAANEEMVDQDAFQQIAVFLL